VEVKRNIKQAWWQAVVQQRDDMVGLDASILMHPRTWEASGHLKGFADPLVECKSCHLRWRSDDLKGNSCPSCGGELTEPRLFNLMFRTFIGPIEEQASVVYLRPETAQGMFVNFENVVNTTRKRLPFGIAQMGKAFRNEVTTGNFIFRCREFEQMEIEFFVRPETDKQWFDYWVEERLNWYVKLGIKRENLKLRQHSKEELAHYARECYDIDYLFPMGWAELEGIANRGDFDLVQHATFSGKSLAYYDEETKQHIIPHIIEPSAGVDRSFLAFLCDAYDEDIAEGEKRVVLRFHPDLAPIKVAVLPLSRRENLVSLAKEIYTDLRRNLMMQYDDAQSIGRRYRRQDEIGTPFCVTIDFQSLEDKQVTIRERDSLNQIRVPISELKNTLQVKLAGEDLFVLPPGGKIWKEGEHGKIS
jgi:glycyl-tRNA synthetase